MEGQSYVISDGRASAQAQSCPLDDEKQPLRAAARQQDAQAQPGSCEEAAFIKTYAVPQTRFERVNSAVSSNGRPLSIFRTVIRLADWQSRSGQECALVYLKAVETDTDCLGNTAEITLGYSIVSR